MKGIITFTLLTLWAAAALAQEATSTTPSNTTNQTGQNAVPKVSATGKPSPIIEEVVNMLQAGVSGDVLRSYIENWSTPFNLSAADIIALKQRSVPDDVTTALVKRSAALRAQAGPAKNQEVRVRQGGQNYYALDPEGYDYFRYYYLYPRTLAAANQRLYAPYSHDSYYWPYGYAYGPSPFYPLPPSAFRRH